MFWCSVLKSTLEFLRKKNNDRLSKSKIGMWLSDFSFYLNQLQLLSYGIINLRLRYSVLTNTLIGDSIMKKLLLRVTESKNHLFLILEGLFSGILGTLKRICSVPVMSMSVTE